MTTEQKAVMKMETDIVAAIIAKDRKDLLSSLRRLKGKVSNIQIDIMDGKFVGNQTLSIKELGKLPIDFEYEFHMMIEEPHLKIIDAAKAGCTTFIFHYESVADKSQIPFIIKTIRAFMMRPGIAIAPKTKPEEIKPFIKDIEQVLVMTVEPGFGGQELIPSALKKISKLNRWSKNIVIEVDGGVNTETIYDCRAAGAEKFVVGSGILKAKDISSALMSLSAASQYKTQ